MIEEDLLTEDNRLNDLEKIKENLGESENELMNNYFNAIGRHEAQDRTFVAQENIENYLCGHPFIVMDKESWRLANIANQSLIALYQRLANIDLK